MIKASDYRIGNIIYQNGKIIKVTTLAIDFNEKPNNNSK
jgi:hypothetical protein